MRLIAVLESLDNGKSIRETRDADTQIVARHLYHHAGWAELMETEMKGKLFAILLEAQVVLIILALFAKIHGKKPTFNSCHNSQS